MPKINFSEIVKSLIMAALPLALTAWVMLAKLEDKTIEMKTVVAALQTAAEQRAVDLRGVQDAIIETRSDVNELKALVQAYNQNLVELKVQQGKNMAHIEALEKRR